MISSELGTFESHDSGRGSVPLGTCGATVFACAHAMWYTPEGARAALSVHSLRCKDHSLADSEDPLAEEPMVDVHLYMPYGKVCSTQCAPDRTRKPACDDAEAVSAIRYRNCTDKRLARGQCSREVLRCLNWNELKEFAIAPDVRLLLGGWTRRPAPAMSSTRSGRRSEGAYGKEVVSSSHRDIGDTVTSFKIDGELSPTCIHQRIKRQASAPWAGCVNLCADLPGMPSEASAAPASVYMVSGLLHYAAVPRASLWLRAAAAPPCVESSEEFQSSHSCQRCS